MEKEFTKEDAIKVLTLMREDLAEEGTVTEISLNMAIEALSE